MRVCLTPPFVPALNPGELCQKKSPLARRFSQEVNRNPLGPAIDKVDDSWNFWLFPLENEGVSEMENLTGKAKRDFTPAGRRGSEVSDVL